MEKQQTTLKISMVLDKKYNFTLLTHLIQRDTRVVRKVLRLGQYLALEIEDKIKQEFTMYYFNTLSIVV